MATIAQIAAHLDVSEETVRQLKKRGVLSAAARGQMDLDVCRVAYIRQLREQAAGRGSAAADAEGLDLVKERARLAKENADRAARRNAVEGGELVPIAEVTAAVVDLIAMSRAHLMKIGGRVAGTDARLKLRIQDAVIEALEELTLARVEERTGGDSTEDPEEE